MESDFVKVYSEEEEKWVEREFPLLRDPERGKEVRGGIN
jgi:hypothetical protein